MLESSFAKTFGWRKLRSEMWDKKSASARPENLGFSRIPER